MATDFTAYVNLASRALGAGVVAANDEWFAEKENLLKAEAPTFRPHTFGPKGQIMDGWETRRRRGASAEHPHPDADAHDWAIIRLGVPGVIRGVVVDTAFFTGNYPPSGSVEAASVPGVPSVEDLTDPSVRWTTIVPRGDLKGDTAHAYDVTCEQRFTHVRLNMFPDGGIARLRVHGEALPDPAWLDGLTVDLGAQEYGAVAEAASDRYFSSPHNLNAPGRSRVMGEGWETRRRRDDGHDWVRVRLVGQTEILAAEIDIDNYLGNAPGWVALVGSDATVDADAWFEILPRTRVQPDTRHRFRLSDVPPVTHVRIEVFPDGGIARLRLPGRLTDAGLAALKARFDTA
ncbi:allantoicase [Streptomyces sp. SID3343]|uniref:allantoicase n=1 Tax=Streptomyces sp. SID3343 TaxID=2690260 RepID=UPI0013702BF5|nr:allantoicase [Streptomyces sp. SID3343]MYW02756.1 allantoicase [Streptomyces sp. SID3343]